MVEVVYRKDVFFFLFGSSLAFYRFLSYTRLSEQ
jgi:hypothetical protein